LVDGERHDDEYSPAYRPVNGENHTNIRRRQIKPAGFAGKARTSGLALPSPRPSRSVAALVPTFSLLT